MNILPRQDRRVRTLRPGVVFAVSLCLYAFASGAQAQEKRQQESSDQAAIAELRQQLAEMRALVERMNARLSELESKGRGSRPGAAQAPTAPGISTMPMAAGGGPMEKELAANSGETLGETVTSAAITPEKKKAE